MTQEQRKQAEEILQKATGHMKLSFGKDQLFLKEEVFAAMEEYANLPRIEITEEQINALDHISKRSRSIFKEDSDQEQQWYDDMEIVDSLLSRLSERKEQKTTERHIPTDEEIHAEARSLYTDISHPNSYAAMRWGYINGFKACCEKLTGTKTEEQQKDEISIRKIIGLKIQHLREIRIEYVKAGNINAQLATDDKINILEDVLEDVEEDEQQKGAPLDDIAKETNPYDVASAHKAWGKFKRRN